MAIFNNKGQAAIEFLTTYGWMLLLVVAVIGAMSYYGFGDAKSAVPSSCYMGQTFDCKAFALFSNGGVGFELVNLEQKPINVSKVLVKYPSEDQYYEADFSSTPGFGVGETFHVLVLPDSSFTGMSGKDKVEVRLIYTYDEQDALTKSATGEIISEILIDSNLMNTYKSAAYGDDLFLNGMTLFNNP